MPYFNIMFWRLITHTTLWTNVIVKMTILRLLGSSDDKEKRGEARPDDLKEIKSPVEPTPSKLHTSVH